MDSSDTVPGYGRTPSIPLLGRAGVEGPLHHQYRAARQHDLSVQYEHRREADTVR